MTRYIRPPVRQPTQTAPVPSGRWRRLAPVPVPARAGSSRNIAAERLTNACPSDLSAERGICKKKNLEKEKFDCADALALRVGGNARSEKSLLHRRGGPLTSTGAAPGGQPEASIEWEAGFDERWRRLSP
jgi:hypothetical protein